MWPLPALSVAGSVYAVGGGGGTSTTAIVEGSPTNSTSRCVDPTDCAIQHTHPPPACIAIFTDHIGLGVGNERIDGNIVSAGPLRTSTALDARTNGLAQVYQWAWATRIWALAVLLSPPLVLFCGVVTCSAVAVGRGRATVSTVLVTATVVASVVVVSALVGVIIVVSVTIVVGVDVGSASASVAVGSIVAGNAVATATVATLLVLVVDLRFG